MISVFTAENAILRVAYYKRCDERCRDFLSLSKKLILFLKNDIFKLKRVRERERGRINLFRDCIKIFSRENGSVFKNY